MNLISLGVDMAARFFVAALRLDHNRYIKTNFPNDGRGFRRLDRWLQTHMAGKVRVGIECTNIYGEQLAHWLHGQGHEVFLLNPERIAHYAKATGQRNKTDPADARTIAAFVALHEDLTRWTPPPAEQADLRALTRTRRQLVQLREQAANQLRTTPAASRSFLEQTVAQLNAQIAAVLKAIRDHLRHHPRLAQQVRRLRTVKGIGELTAAITVAELPPIDASCDPRAVAAWAGLIPRRRQTGKTELPSHLSRKGNAHLRDALFMPALVAKRYNPLLRDYAERLRQRGKRPGAILGAVAHKLLRILVAMLKNQTDFDPNWSFSST